MTLFDTCIVTASDAAQASMFRGMIDRRRAAGLYPREIGFAVYEDPRGVRVGSGGGTLAALLAHAEAQAPGIDPEEFFSGRSVLIIHAGGESRRLPCYVPEGKLFAPVPAGSSSLLPPVILDLELSLYLRYPWEKGELVVASGDVIVDFDTESFELPGGAPVVGIAAPESFDRGSRHGVFVFDPLDGHVRDYVQKESPEYLARSARIEGTDSCAVDLGIVSFRGAGLAALFALARAKSGGRSIADLLRSGEFGCDLYLELLTACPYGRSFGEYFERLAGRSLLPRSLLRTIHRIFGGLGLGGCLVRRHSFIHFGSLAEYPAACRELGRSDLQPFNSLGREELPARTDGAVIRFNCVGTVIETGASQGALPVVAENCRDTRLVCDPGVLVCGLRGFASRVPVPAGFCIDRRSLRDGREVHLVCHRDDDFKPVRDSDGPRFCGMPLGRWLVERGMSAPDLFVPRTGADGAAVDLYRLPLFVPGADAEFVAGYWSVPAEAAGWRERFMAAERISLADANTLSDALARDGEREEARALVLASSLADIPFASISGADLARLAERGADLSTLALRCKATDDPLLKAYRRAALACVPGMASGPDTRVEVSFATRLHRNTLRLAVKQDQIVWARSPVRLDIAGGWTDTPPYTNRYGGAVVNVAVDLNGQSPIQVFVRRMAEPFVRIHSIDLGLTEDIRTAGSLRAYTDPGSAFALPRAALVLLGLDQGLSDQDGLGPAFADLAPGRPGTGNGLEISLLCAVPKGSGLGTSSILAGTILAALERFFGVTGSRDELFLKVLETEQMLTTGGGWQDQIGGLSGGIKYIESKPALKPRPVIHQLDPWLFEDPESTSRMTLFYTGVTRLAKGILADVVAGVNSLDRSYLFTHARLKRLAEVCRDAVSRRDIETFAAVVRASFGGNRLIHPSTTNPEIDRMASETAKYWKGMKLLGAGGGGFALFVSPDRRSAARLRSLLADRFEDDRARLVDFSLDKRGLEVTVS